MQPTSSLSTSPGLSVRLPGIPWTTCSFTEVQMVPGKPRYPLNDGKAPSPVMILSAIASRSAVVIPGRTSSISRSTVRAVMRPERRINSISWGDFNTIIGPSAPRPSSRARKRGHQSFGDLLLRTIGIHEAQQTSFGVESEERLRALLIDLEASSDGHLVVVVAPDEPATA